jgi:hypothetical protein
MQCTCSGPLVAFQRATWRYVAEDSARQKRPLLNRIGLGAFLYSSVWMINDEGSVAWRRRETWRSALKTSDLLLFITSLLRVINFEWRSSFGVNVVWRNYNSLLPWHHLSLSLSLSFWLLFLSPTNSRRVSKLSRDKFATSTLHKKRPIASKWKNSIFFPSVTHNKILNICSLVRQCNTFTS